MFSSWHGHVSTLSAPKWIKAGGGLPSPSGPLASPPCCQELLSEGLSSPVEVVEVILHSATCWESMDTKISRLDTPQCHRALSAPSARGLRDRCARCARCCLALALAAWLDPCCVEEVEVPIRGSHPRSKRLQKPDPRRKIGESGVAGCCCR